MCLIKRSKQKKISRDCWSLDWAFLNWLQPRLKTYLKEAGNNIDLNYHKITIEGKEMTQKEVIERMIELVDRLNDEECETSLYWNDGAEWEEELIELCKLWAEVLPAMWW